MNKKKKIYKKKGNTIKDLSQKILKLLAKNPSKTWNYKQISSTLKLTDANSRGQVIKNLEELKAKIQEVFKSKK